LGGSCDHYERQSKVGLTGNLEVRLMKMRIAKLVNRGDALKINSKSGGVQLRDEFQTMLEEFWDVTGAII
jgi:hypothetical protein